MSEDKTTENKQFWTVDELAAAAGVGSSYIRRLLAEGVIKAQKVGGEGRRGTWLIPSSSASQWLDTRKRS